MGSPPLQFAYLMDRNSSWACGLFTTTCVQLGREGLKAQVETESHLISHSVQHLSFVIFRNLGAAAL